MTPRGGRRPVYRPGRYGPPNEGEAVEIAVGAILTQNAAWSNVESALEALHRSGPISLEGLRRMPARRLELLIRSSGYFRQKARKLRDFADATAARGGRLLAWLSGDDARGQLLEVRGIGPETADSILLYAAHRDAFVVDAYTLRIGARVGWFPAAANYAAAQELLSGALGGREKGASRVRVYQEFHALLVRLAKLQCRTQPLCGGCPLREGCRHAA